jgi:hypothetical protein
VTTCHHGRAVPAGCRSSWALPGQIAIIDQAVPLVSSAAISKFESYTWSSRGEIIGRTPMIENPESGSPALRFGAPE